MKRLNALLTVVFLVVLATAAFAVDPGVPWKHNRFTLGKDTLQWKGAYLIGGTPIVLEGATDDAYETSIVVTDPTADRTITIPNSSGTIALNPAAGSIEFEGDTANDFETTLAVVDPTADRTVTIPDSTGTVMLTAGTGSYLTVSAGSGTNTLTVADCGKVFTAAADADAVFNLPAKAAGCTFTFLNIGAAGNNLLTVNPDNADSIFGTVTLAASVVVISGAAGDAISNTKATTQKGDSVSIIATSAGWIITASTGIWADIN